MTLSLEGGSLVTNSRGCKGESAERDAKLLMGVRAAEEKPQADSEVRLWRRIGLIGLI